MPERKPTVQVTERKPSVVDLFSGLGGLSAGLNDAGFKVVVASEVDGDAIATYRANHPQVKLLGDIRQLTGAKILKAARRAHIDVVVGCPPCQGFSRLTEKHRSRDPRNGLVLEFLRIVGELKPTICMMENVPGLMTRGSSLFKKLLHGLEEAGYQVKHAVLELADFGVPQTRKRLVLVAGLGFDVELPSPTHPGSENWVPAKRAIGALPKAVSRDDISRNRVPAHWHIARAISDDVRKRLKHAATHGGSRNSLPKRLALECHKRRTDGFSDVYGVIDLDAPSPTITSGCTNASKGRFGHPREHRPLTPREAAMLQTLGRDYKLRGTGVESVAMQIGNALPRRFAKVAGKHLLKALAKQKAALRKNHTDASP